MIDLVQPARIAAQMTSDVAGAAAAGAVLNSFWLTPDARVPLAPVLRRWLIVAALLAAVSSCLEFLALTAIMTGTTAWVMVRAAIPDVLTTEAGHTLALLCGGSAVLTAFALIPSVLRRKSLRIAALALVASLSLLRTPLGHASADGPWTVREAVQLIHLLSVAIWGGGVMIAGLIGTPKLLSRGDTASVLALTQRLSGTVTVALPCVLLSGVYNSWKGLGGSLSPLPHTEWGQILLAKLALVLAALALGARMRQRLHRSQQDHLSAAAHAQFLHRWLRVEAIAMLSILVLSAWLANAPPANMTGALAPTITYVS